jgi:polyphosphate kinase 2 (PPK2 family)
MVERTSTGEVPWHLVESNDKNHARIKILRTLCETVEQALAAAPGDKPRTKKGKPNKA